MRKAAWLILFVGGLGWLIFSGISQVRQEKAIREMLLEVQSALQDYHVEQEQYIPRLELTGTEVITVLSDFDSLKKLPLNPWSGETWRLDGEEPDHLIYQTDPSFETYALRALHPKTGKVVLEIDSESNPSLATR